MPIRVHISANVVLPHFCRNPHNIYTTNSYELFENFDVQNELIKNEVKLDQPQHIDPIPLEIVFELNY